MTMATAYETAASLTDIFGRSWEGRQVAVVGLGRSGMAAAELLCRVGCRVWATDAHDTPTLRVVRDTLLRRHRREGAAAGVVEDVELGHHSRRLIEGAELVVVSPGVPETTGPIAWALERRLPILSEIELAFHFCPSPIVAVTGTNGKTTTVSLIAELLRASGRQAIACGNLGIPFSSVIGALTSRSVAVVEVSSFQLLWCGQFRPTISVLLNFSVNHLDRHQDPTTYFEAKATIFQRQTPQDWAVLNGRDPRITALTDRLHAQCVWFGENRSNGPIFRLASQTQHALTDSAQAVLQVGRIFGIPDPLAWQVIRSFRGLEHRLEHVATVRGVRFVNDSKSTTPESLLFALHRTQGPLVVIMGGRDKGMDFQPLITPLHDSRVKGIVLIGESRPRMHALLNGSLAVREGPTLEEAVQTAVGLSAPGTTVLFSPACASFDMFRDFEDRGRAFKAIIQRLAKG